MFIEALGIIVGLPKRLEAFRSVSKYTEVGGVTTLFFFFASRSRRREPTKQMTQ